MKILVVEDDPVCTEMLDYFLRQSGYDVTLAANGREAFDLLRDGDFRVVISDWEMPEMSGLELCRRIRNRQFSEYVYVILLTCREGRGDMVAGLNAGADDFLTKPFQPDELNLRVGAAERIVKLESRDLLIFSLAKLAESRDPETGAHLERMREYCRILGDQLSKTPEFRDRVDADFVRTLYQTSPLHDIGKVGVPDAILLKPGRLAPEEFEIMKQHAAIGGRTLDAALQAHPRAEYLRLARDIAWSHHERYDGKGYPRGLAGDEIPLAGRIVAVADVYDALTTRRVYKPAFSHEKAKAIILDGRGTQFDPSIIDAFLAREDDFITVKESLSEAPDEEMAAIPLGPVSAG
ncbi:MAG: response regulator [Planctomycetes bacterium]|nr:response regulator [Planctomycetota bacterium]